MKTEASMNLCERIPAAFYRILAGALALLSAALFLYALFATVVFRRLEENDYPDVIHLHPLFVLAVFAVLLAAGFLLFRRNGLADHPDSPRCIHTPSILIPEKSLVAALLFALIVSVFFLAVIRGLPTNDAKILDEVTQAFLAGDYSAIRDGYISIYPFQLSYCLISEGLTKLFGAGSYAPYQWLNILSILLTVFFLYEITWEVYGDLRICRLVSVLSFGCFMLYTYSTYIYNDIWCLAPLFGGFWLMIRFLRYDRTAAGIGGAILTAVSFCIKSNGTIAVIAMAVMIGITMLGQLQNKELARALRCLLILAVLIAACLFLRRGVNALYEARSGEKIPGGVPAMAYFSMGMTESDGKFGWYNGDNVRFLKEAGGDSGKAAAAAKLAAKERLSYLTTHPKALLRFYGRKFLSQWGDPTKAAIRELELTSRHQSLGPLAESLTLGTGATILTVIMHLFHLLLTFGCMIEFASWCAGKKTLTAVIVLLPLFVFGGMLFHQIWEASSRYTLRYALALIPFAAGGLLRVLCLRTGERNHGKE